MLCWRFTIHNALSRYVVCKSLSTIVMLVVHTPKGIQRLAIVMVFVI